MPHNETLNRINEVKQSTDILDTNLNTEEFEARAANILMHALPAHVYRDMDLQSSDHQRGELSELKDSRPVSDIVKKAGSEGDNEAVKN